MLGGMSDDVLFSCGLLSYLVDLVAWHKTDIANLNIVVWKCSLSNNTTMTAKVLYSRSGQRDILTVMKHLQKTIVNYSPVLCP